MKCGYVAVLGRSNAGKSSLVNFLVGEEVAIISHRRQTTRNSILGIKSDADYQIIFVDTPGIHHSKNNLDKFMMKNVRSAIAGADVVLYLVDGSKKIDDEEREYIQTLKEKVEDNLILVQTKLDKKQVENLENSHKISVKTGENVDDLLKKIIEKLPNREPIFEEDLYTDRSVAFLISEKIRGALLELLDQEIPHGVAVVIEKFEESEERVQIDALIICEREQHKGIIIGKGGENLKKIGKSAREYAEHLLEKKCVLKLFVKVDKDWRNNNVGAYYK